MKNILGLAILIFILVWGTGTAILYVQRMHSDVMKKTQVSYGDFSPQAIQDDQKRFMEAHKREFEQYRQAQKSLTSGGSAQEMQDDFMADQVNGSSPASGQTQDEFMAQHKRELEQYRRSQGASSAESAQDMQKRFMRQQKQQMEDLKRQNKM